MLTKVEKEAMMRVGFEPSKLSEAMDRASEAIELRERLDASPAGFVAIRMKLGDNETLNEATYWVSRVKFLALMVELEKETVERAHRLMHGVTGD